MSTPAASPTTPTRTTPTTRASTPSLPVLPPPRSRELRKRARTVGEGKSGAGSPGAGQADREKEHLPRYRPQHADEITRDIIGKLNDLAAAASAKSGEERINIKIQELALNKLLVLNYGKSDFRLVLAHYHLGEAYLAFDCLEQTIEHVSLALHKIEKLTPEVPRAELVQINMYITLAEAFMAQGNFDDALEVLAKASNLE